MTPATKPLRLFFALWPDEAVRGALAGWAEAIHRAAGGRPTRPESIHLTLAFLGDTHPGRLAELERAAAAARVEPFELVLDRCGAWNHNRLAWAGASATPPALARLSEDLRAALAAGAFPFDAKPFVPHLTLVRKVRPPFALPELAPIRWPVREFVLVRSAMRAGGSDYAIAARWRAP